MSGSSIARLKSLSRELEGGMPPTQLFPTRAEVDSSNRIQLAKLKVPSFLKPG